MRAFARGSSAWVYESTLQPILIVIVGLFLVLALQGCVSCDHHADAQAIVKASDALVEAAERAQVRKLTPEELDALHYAGEQLKREAAALEQVSR